MEISPTFSELLASGSLLDVPSSVVFDSIDEMNKPGNEIVCLAARDVYEDFINRSDFGAVEVADDMASRKADMTREAMFKYIRASPIQIADAFTARDSGSSGTYDAMELRYYTR